MNNSELNDLQSSNKDLLKFARTQIENEVELEQILAQLKQKGINEEEATKIIQEASISADLEKKQNEAAAKAVTKEEGSVWTWISAFFTIFVIIRIIMRISG